VLDQRVARVHRLGQKNKVQVLHLVAPDSYEDHVLELVGGKRDLFENVVSFDATEDVVGVSKRLAEILAEDLGGSAEGSETTTRAEPLPPAEASAPKTAHEQPGEPGREAADRGIADEVRRCIVELQSDLGPRIERILGAKGGLLVVLEDVTNADDERAAAISQQVPIVIIDRRTLKGLQRLGAMPPDAEAESLYKAPTEPSGTTRPLVRKARQKLEAAEMLLRQDCAAPAGELLLGALLCASALRCGLDDPPEPRNAGIWLYSHALPSGKLRQEDASLIMRALGFAQADEQVPQELLAALAADTARFVEDAVVS
jgi:hypothetical protein